MEWNSELDDALLAVPFVSRTDPRARDGDGESYLIKFHADDNSRTCCLLVIDPLSGTSYFEGLSARQVERRASDAGPDLDSDQSWTRKTEILHRALGRKAGGKDQGAEVCGIEVEHTRYSFSLKIVMRSTTGDSAPWTFRWDLDALENERAADVLARHLLRPLLGLATVFGDLWQDAVAPDSDAERMSNQLQKAIDAHARSAHLRPHRALSTFLGSVRSSAAMTRWTQVGAGQESDVTIELDATVPSGSRRQRPKASPPKDKVPPPSRAQAHSASTPPPRASEPSSSRSRSSSPAKRPRRGPPRASPPRVPSPTLSDPDSDVSLDDTADDIVIGGPSQRPPCSSPMQEEEDQMPNMKNMKKEETDGKSRTISAESTSSKKGALPAPSPSSNESDDEGPSMIGLSSKPASQSRRTRTTRTTPLSPPLAADPSSSPSPSPSPPAATMPPATFMPGPSQVAKTPAQIEREARRRTELARIKKEAEAEKIAEEEIKDKVKEENANANAAGESTGSGDASGSASASRTASAPARGEAGRGRGRVTARTKRF